MRKAFTLIELLVVIAIIAILAAILFPVFAQAKSAAKGAAAISNVNQIGKAELMYAADADDLNVLSGNNEADAKFKLKGTTPYKPWSLMLGPYIKNYEIFHDPLDQPEPVTADLSEALTAQYKTQFGYAFSIHAPTIFYPQYGRYVPTGHANSALGAPAETVMFLEKKSRKGNPDWYWEESAIWGANVVNPPGCRNNYVAPNTSPMSLCAPVNFWGSDSPSYATQTFEEGRTTGGVAFRRVGRAVVNWADGHASAVPSGRLAAGTTWTPYTPSAAVTVTDKSRFLWDAE